MDTRSTVLARQEERMKSQIKEAQTKLQEDLSPVSATIILKVKLVVELGIPELTTEQIETLCSTAEKAARKYVLSKVSSKMVVRLDISVEATGSKPCSVSVEIDLALSSETKDVDAEVLVKEATNEAHKAIEKYLRKIK